MFLDVVYVTAGLWAPTAELVETFLLFFLQLQKSKKKTQTNENTTNRSYL